MNIQAEKIHLAQLILETEDETILKKIKSLFKLRTKSRISIRAYNEEIEKSEKQIRQGKYLTQEDLEKQAEKW